MHTDPRNDDLTTAPRAARRRLPVPRVPRAGRAAVAILALVTCGLITACDPLPPQPIPPTAPACAGFKPTILGTAGNDSITGTFGRDIIHGLGGNDSIRGLDGHDVLCGGSGKDVIYGGADADTVDPGEDIGNELIGGTGTDILTYVSFKEGGVTVNLQTGIGGRGDRVAEFESVIGTTFTDDITGSSGINHLNGNGGNDTIAGGAGDDGILTLSKAGQSTRIIPGPGNDNVEGGAGFDTVDFYLATAPVSVDLGAAGIARGEGNDNLKGIDGVIGSTFSDTLIGNNGNNDLDGRHGDDVLDGRGGNDTIKGNYGYDRVIYVTATNGVVVNLATGSATGQGDDFLRADIEHITGSRYDDLLTGTADANKIDGSAGVDICVGNGGQDTFTSCP